MDDVLQFLVLFLMVLLIILSLQYYRRRWPVANFPPGPTGVPIIGALLSITSNYFHRNVSELAKRYGNVYSFMLDTPMVVLNGFEVINEAFQSKNGFDFASRRESRYLIQLTNPNKIGLFSADYSPKWQQQRRFALSTLCGFGYGKSSFEVKITENVQGLLIHLKGLAEVPQDLSSLITSTVTSIMCNIVLGCQNYDEDQELQQFIQRLLSGSSNLGKTKMVLMNYVPFSRLFLKREAQFLKDDWKLQSSFLKSRIKDHQIKLKSRKGLEPRDFVDCYLAKMAEEPDVFTIEELQYVLSDLFFASIDTTSNTVKFALLYMVVNPDVQEKVHQELIRVVGHSRLPRVDDRDKTPYTAATLYEILRLSCVSLTVPRCATTDTKIAGYTITKGTNVLINIWGLSYDPVLWPNPERFDPTRFLNDKGEVIENPHLLSFGAGRRVCIGKSFVNTELYLFFSILIHQLKFELPPNADTPSLEPVIGFTLSPQPFQVLIKEYPHT